MKDRRRSWLLLLYVGDELRRFVNEEDQGQRQKRRGGDQGGGGFPVHRASLWRSPERGFPAWCGVVVNGYRALITLIVIASSVNAIR